MSNGMSSESYWRQYAGDQRDDTSSTKQSTVWCRAGGVPRAELKVPKYQLSEDELSKYEWDLLSSNMPPSPRLSDNILFTTPDDEQPQSPTSASNDDDQTSLRGDKFRLDSSTQVVPSNTTRRRTRSQPQLSTPTYTAIAGASNAASSSASQAGTASGHVGVVSGQPSLRSTSGISNPGTCSENNPATFYFNHGAYRAYEAYEKQERMLQDQ